MKNPDSKSSGSAESGDDGAGLAREPEGKASSTRGRSASNRKEKVLHTRISESLDEEIKQRAQTLGMSVSTVVRNVLASTFDLVENVVHDSAQSIADETAGAGRNRRSSGSSSRFSDDSEGAILGWQEAKLQINAVCDRCNCILEKGTLAAIAVRDGIGARTIVCVPCETRLVAEGEDLATGEKS